MRIIGIVFILMSFLIQPALAQKGWFAVDEPFINLNWLDVHFLNNDFGFVSGEEGRIKRTTNGGVDWEFRESNVSTTLNAIQVVNQNLIFAAGFEGALTKSTDGGDTWSPIATGTNETILDVLFIDEMEGYIVGSKSMLLKTTDGGASWEQQNSRFNNNNIQQIEAFDRDNLIICGNAGNIARTTNGGQSWKKQATPFGNELYSISFSDTLHGYCVGVSATIMRTTNGGADWEIHDPGFPVPTLPLNSISVPDRNHVYACGWNAMILGKWNGVDWEVQKIPAGYEGQHLTGIYFPSPTVGYAVGWNGTILKTVNGGTLPVEQVDATPGNFALSPMYPNPVAAGRETTVEFSIATTSDVVLKVYDVLGNEVIELDRGVYNPGRYSTRIQTATLPRGMYMVRLTSGGTTVTQKFAVGL